MAVPTCSVEVDPTRSQENLHSGIRQVCKAVVKEWKDVEASDIGVSKITGGITNLLMKASVETKGVSLTNVTVRIFGPNTETVIDRDRERQALYHLSTSGFGAHLIGLFQNGMVQSFLVARTFTPSDMYQPNMVPLIAKELRKLHETKVPGLKEPQLWEDIKKFVRAASSLSFDDAEKQKQYERISFSELNAEVQELERISDLLRAPVLFCHNDLLSGNIMYNDETGDMYFIDYEYSTYSFRGYDIGNHFNEYAGFDCDFSLYPNKEAQLLFFRHYLHPESPQKATDAELETLYIETNFYSLASHLFWGVWGIIQARYSPIEFNYLDYFFERYNEFKRRKNHCLSLVQSSGNGL